jgi:hypothetical protein
MVFPKPINMLPLMIKFIRRGLKYVFTKCAHVILCKCISYLNKASKGWQEWNKTCVETSLRPRKLNTLMKTKLVLFLDILYFLKFFYARFFDFGVFKLFC